MRIKQFSIGLPPLRLTSKSYRLLYICHRNEKISWMFPTSTGIRPTLTVIKMWMQMYLFLKHPLKFSKMDLARFVHPSNLLARVVLLPFLPPYIRIHPIETFRSSIILVLFFKWFPFPPGKRFFQLHSWFYYKRIIRELKWFLL